MLYLIQRFPDAASFVAMTLREAGLWLTDAADAVDLALGWDEVLYVPDALLVDQLGT